MGPSFFRTAFKFSPQEIQTSCKGSNQTQNVSAEFAKELTIPKPAKAEIGLKLFRCPAESAGLIGSEVWFANPAVSG